MAAVSFTAGMLAIILALMLYVSLAASNFGRDNDQLVSQWVQNHYWLLVGETIFIILSVLFVWVVAYFVGLIKSEVDRAWRATAAGPAPRFVSRPDASRDAQSGHGHSSAG